MNIIQRYKRLNFWNKFFVWGAIASIAGLVSFGVITVINGDNIGRDKIIVSGDYVGGNKIVNEGQSEEELEEIIERQFKSFESKLAERYPGGYAVFGVRAQGLVIPKGLVPNNIEVDWETGKVDSISDDRIRITLPDTIIPGFRIYGNSTTLARKVGAKSGPLISIGGVSSFVEVIGIHGDLVVVALGFIVDHGMN